MVKNMENGVIYRVYGDEEVLALFVVALGRPKVHNVGFRILGVNGALSAKRLGKDCCPVRV